MNTYENKGHKALNTKKAWKTMSIIKLKAWFWEA